MFREKGIEAPLSEENQSFGIVQGIDGITQQEGGFGILKPGRLSCFDFMAVRHHSLKLTNNTRDIHYCISRYSQGDMRNGGSFHKG